jgi:hypothetical protein
MTTYQTAEAQKLSSTSTANYATFPGGIQQLYIAADGDCYITFDEQQPVIAGHALFIKGGLAPVRIDFRGGSVQKVWAISSGSVSIYLLGVRN